MKNTPKKGPCLVARPLIAYVLGSTPRGNWFLKKKSQGSDSYFWINFHPLIPAPPLSNKVKNSREKILW